MLVKTLKRAVIGFLLGVLLGNLIAYLTAENSENALFVAPQLIKILGSESKAFLLQSILSGLIGIAGFAGMSFYDIDSWSMTRTIVVHFLIILIVFLICAKILFWIGSFFDAFILIVIMSVAYFAIWLIMTAIYRAQVRKLNKNQEELSSKINSRR